MIFLNKHGRTAVPDGTTDAYGADGAMPVSQACGYTESGAYGAPEFGPFDYFFREAPDLPHSPGTTARLDALADAMVEQDPEEADDSRIPPVITYLGQFIDHDITANTDREVGLSVIDVPEVAPMDRATVVQGIGNLRAGALNLDSLYGGGPIQGPFSERMAEALRFPPDRAKLWVGTLSETGFGSVPLPNDPAGDLLRLGRILREPHRVFTEDEIKALPAPLREMFVNADGTLRIQRAIIGDPRNDENLALSQLHLAFVRFHNRVVDEAGQHLADTTDREAVFAWARRMVTWVYQWIVLHEYLPTICDPDTVADVMARGAPLYSAFRARVQAPRPDLMPMPLEFSVAAFRFGHSMVRATYDWNRFFGRAVPGITPFTPGATMAQLFEFTGGAPVPMPLPDASGSTDRLPTQWPVEWDRFARPVTQAFPDRAARRIDTLLALPLSDLANEGEPGILRHLARRNLRRGHRLNIPSAQACLEGVNGLLGADMPMLTVDDLCSHPATGEALRAGGFVSATPLWFYVLKEAEILGSGGRLGPLGSRLVAETLVGLAVHDPTSFWNQAGSDANGRWHPQDGVRPTGAPIIGIAGLLHAAGVL